MPEKHAHAIHLHPVRNTLHEKHAPHGAHATPHPSHPYTPRAHAEPAHAPAHGHAAAHPHPHGHKETTVAAHDPAVVPQGAFSTLLPQLQKAVAEEGYVTPTPIQSQAIPHLLNGRDILGCAQTGTGKTAAFILPILQYRPQQKRPPARGRPRVLILTPTRELAAQIGDSIHTYGRHVHVSHTVIFGGVGQNPQVSAVNRGVDFVVATPGRLLDLKQQGHIRLDGVEVFVLDEADRMLDMGFIHDIRKVISGLPRERQSLFFSATMPAEVVALAHAMVRNPVQITIEPERPTVERIAQKVLFVEKKDKDALLVSILRNPKMDKVIVFTQMKHIADKVTQKLVAAGITAAAIHGNKSQSARTQTLLGFKLSRVRALVATDIAARGIDVDGITHVINYDLPGDPETYIHRIGRTARAGAEGDAISFCCGEDRSALNDIERLIRKAIPAELQHPLHSEAARTATGAASRPPPRQQQRHRSSSSQHSRGGSGGAHRSGGFSHGGSRPHSGPPRRSR